MTSAAGIIPSVIGAIATGLKYGSAPPPALSLPLVLAEPGGSGAGGCPAGGQATKTSSLPPTDITLKDCKVDTADGLIRFKLNGQISLTGSIFSLNIDADVTVEITNASETITLEKARAVLHGAIANPAIDFFANCKVTGGTLQLTSGSLLSAEFPGVGTVSMGLEGSTIDVNVLNFSTQCVPQNYELTFDGPATIDEVPAGGGGAAVKEVSVTFDGFKVSQDVRTAPAQTRLDGNVTGDCFGGGTVAVATDQDQPLIQAVGNPCPTGGILYVTADSQTSRVIYTSSGGVNVDLGNDQTIDEQFGTCTDPNLFVCPAG